MLPLTEPLNDASSVVDVEVQRAPAGSRYRTIISSAAIFLGLFAVVVVNAHSDPSKGTWHQKVAADTVNLDAQENWNDYIKWWKAHWFLAMEIGRIMVVHIFLVAGTNLGVEGFTSIAQQMGYPCPSLMGFAAFIAVYAGSAGLLLGPALNPPSPYVSMLGASALIVFLVFATYSGHYRPMIQASGEHQAEFRQSFLKNISMLGSLIITFGRDLTLIGLHQSEQGFPCFGSCSDTSFYVRIVGRVAMVLVFVEAMWCQGIEGYIQVVQQINFPAPGFMGLMGFLFCLGGSVLFVWAPFAGSAMYSIIGAKLLFVFLALATYTCHFKPMQSSSGSAKMTQQQLMMKNLAIMGGLLMAMGYDLKDL
eukprot:TRINITY_DN40264_c0_g1_i1.p1 TRINITY_DN40264_c0_g1~~TRINITY_DN40264_c0_g1_i1.p1  ORF type:complete len:364 (-),score=71.39 TRINITY_DN40264_c0_g1_i1:53-1144(-)